MSSEHSSSLDSSSKTSGSILQLLSMQCLHIDVHCNSLFRHLHPLHDVCLQLQRIRVGPWYKWEWKSLRLCVICISHGNNFWPSDTCTYMYTVPEYYWQVPDLEGKHFRKTVFFICQLGWFKEINLYSFKLATDLGTLKRAISLR